MRVSPESFSFFSVPLFWPRGRVFRLLLGTSPRSHRVREAGGVDKREKRSQDMEKVLPKCREEIMFWGWGAESICVPARLRRSLLFCRDLEIVILISSNPSRFWSFERCKDKPSAYLYASLRTDPN
jgi:hypothetical protein